MPPILFWNDSRKFGRCPVRNSQAGRGSVREEKEVESQPVSRVAGRERRSADLYDGLAKAAHGERREILNQLAAVERRHSEHWAGKLVELGEPVPEPGSRGARTRVLSWPARRFSIDAVLPYLERGERADAGMYQDDPEATSDMAVSERSHARVLWQCDRLGEPRPVRRRGGDRCPQRPRRPAIGDATVADRWRRGTARLRDRSRRRCPYRRSARRCVTPRPTVNGVAAERVKVWSRLRCRPTPPAPPSRRCGRPAPWWRRSRR